jgi:hypothetical protein
MNPQDFSNAITDARNSLSYAQGPQHPQVIDRAWGPDLDNAGGYDIDNAMGPDVDYARGGKGMRAQKFLYNLNFTTLGTDAGQLLLVPGWDIMNGLLSFGNGVMKSGTAKVFTGIDATALATGTTPLLNMTSPGDKDKWEQVLMHAMFARPIKVTKMTLTSSTASVRTGLQFTILRPNPFKKIGTERVIEVSKYALEAAQIQLNSDSVTIPEGFMIDGKTRVFMSVPGGGAQMSLLLEGEYYTSEHEALAGTEPATAQGGARPYAPAFVRANQLAPAGAQMAPRGFLGMGGR